MSDREGRSVYHPDLDDLDKYHIMEVFSQEVVPKLKKLDARLGTLCCGFAGEQFKNWTIQFKSVGSDFEIVEFEFDADADSIDLDL
jgi:hypothetical protein